MTNWSRLRYFALVPKNWLQLTVHNSWGILNVLDIIWLRPMRGGLIDDRHPFCTGLNPATGRMIWNDNVIFRTAPRVDWPAGHRPPDPDELIIEKTGDHLRRQVCLAAASVGHPHGRPAPMPPGILYLHGGVHYNGGWLLFNDFEEAIEHFSDARFAAEFRRFVREERREPVSLFRDRDYDRAAFSRFVCFMRTILPWFSNSNGPKKPVLWGNPAPYASVNTITGHWIQDCRMLKHGSEGAARPPIPSGRYFQNGPYHGDRRTTLWPEHLLARLTERRIAWRGARANLYFVDKRKLEHGFRYGPAPILNPAQRLWRILSRQPATRSTKALVIDSQRTSAGSRDR
jgi:hypothetical protein